MKIFRLPRNWFLKEKLQKAEICVVLERIVTKSALKILLFITVWFINSFRDVPEAPVALNNLQNLIKPQLSIGNFKGYLKCLSNTFFDHFDNRGQ